MRVVLMVSLLGACRGQNKIIEDVDGDGYDIATDCDDYNSSIHPNAPEICDGVDNNCDGNVDAEDALLEDGTDGFIDTDGDGFGVGDLFNGCNVAPVDGDCNDEDPNINPFANEYCNGIDDNCNDEIDEQALDSVQMFIDSDGDGYGSSISTLWQCPPTEGYTTTGGDCDDENPAVNPIAQEVCDGVDNDCDTLVDGADGDIAQDTVVAYYLDLDGDGYGDDSHVVYACEQPEGYVSMGGDCDDNSMGIYPEKGYDGCNGIDEDCDGLIDEDVKSGWQLLSIDTNAGNIYDIDPLSGTTTSIGTLTGDFKINSMDVSENGTSLVHDHLNKKLWELDPCTGQMSALPAVNDSISTCGIAFGPYNKFYGLDTSNDQLVEYNIQTGEATPIGPLGISIGSCGLTYDCSENRLIGANGSTGQIFTVDPNTGQAYDIIQTQVPFQSVGVEFDHATNRLLASTKTELYSVDTSNGNTTFIGPLGGQNIDDLAYYPTCP